MEQSYGTNQCPPEFPGSKIEFTDPRYETLIQGFNLRWKGSPKFVQVTGSAQQVVETVQDAVNRNLRITVRSGGHCYEDFVSGNNGGVIIDLSPMTTTFKEGDLYYVGGGCSNWDSYWHLYKNWGVTIPGGSCYSVGVGGHYTGGGYGLLSRLFGLSIDYLYGVEVVVVDKDKKARLITVTKDSGSREEKDLFWAHTGGGGGNFGIVTSFIFKDLPPAPGEAWIANLAWNWSDLLANPSNFKQLIENYGGFFERHSSVGSQYKGLFALLHLTHFSAKQLVLTAQYVGKQPLLLDNFIAKMQLDSASHTSQVFPVALNHYIGGSVEKRKLPWLYATQTLDPSGANQRGKYKSAYMKKAFPQQQIDTLWKWLTDSNYYNSQALVQVDSYGGRINAIATEATAIPQRSSIMKLQYQTYWTDKADDLYNLEWVRNFYNDMYGEEGPMPDDVMDGCYINYPDVDLKNWQELYYKENYPKLQAVKAYWDPNNIFNHRQSIRR